MMDERAKLMRDMIFIAIGSLLLFGSLVWVREVGFPDLPKFAEIAREMALNHNFVTPYFNGVKELSTPPFYFWIQSLLIDLFGFSFGLLRILSVLMAAFGCLVTYYTASLVFGRRAGLISVACLASNALYFTYSQTIAPYMFGSILLSSCFMCYMIASDSDGTQRKWAFTFFWIFSALSTLTVGLAGILLPLLSIFIWGCVFHYWKFSKDLFRPLNIALYFFIVIPWFVMVEYYNPEFFYYFFIEENFLKILKNLAPSNNALFVVPLFLIALLPWSVFIAQSLWINWPKTWQDRFDHLAAIYLMITCFVIILYIGLIGAKMGWLIALTPTTCILIGRYIDLIWDRAPLAITQFNFEILFMVMVCILSMLIGVSYMGWLGGHPDSHAYLRLLTVTLLIVTMITLPVMRYARFPYAFLTLFVGALVCFNILIISYPHVGGNMNSLIETIKPTVNKQDVVVSYGQFYDELTVSFARPIVAVNWNDRPAYGKKYQNTSAWVVDENTLWKYWHQQDKRFYMFLPKQEFTKLIDNHTEHFHYIASNENAVLVSNFPQQMV